MTPEQRAWLRKQAGAEGVLGVSLTLSAAIVLELLDATEWRPIATHPRGDGMFLVANRERILLVSGNILKLGLAEDCPRHLDMRWATHWCPHPLLPSG